MVPRAAAAVSVRLELCKLAWGTATAAEWGASPAPAGKVLLGCFPRACQSKKGERRALFVE